MHTYRVQIKYLAAALFGLSLWIPALARQQPHGHTPLLDIQQKYARGEIDVETAALEQFRLMYEPEPHERQIHKCATPAFMFLENHRHELSSQTLQKIDRYQAARSLQKNKADQASYISPSGKFEIFYNISGPHAIPQADDNSNDIPDYVEKIAFAADSSYWHQVLTLGFTNPIPDGTTYKILIENDSNGAYGYTKPDGDEPAGTIIYIENDFEGFPPNSHPEGDQIGALYATVAHEFKHAIQYAQNLWRSPAGSVEWSEMDATLMEEVVFDDVNDYYNYIKIGFDSQTPNPSSIFANPARSAPVPYNFVSWMIYYSEAFGNFFWVDVWDLIEENNYKGIDESMIETLPFYGTDFDRQFVRNHLWHFASGSRAPDTEYGFGEKTDYPTPNLDHSSSGAPAGQIPIDNINKLAARYFEVIPEANDRGFVNVAVDFDSTQAGIGLLLYLKTGKTVEHIATGRDKVQVYLPTDVLWEQVERAGMVVANFDLSATTRNLALLVGSSRYAFKIKDPDYVELPDEMAVYQNYPNPFNPRTNISFDLSQPAFVELEVYDITGRKVQTLLSRYLQADHYAEVFDGSALSSGVYLYRLRIDDAVFVKKMTLIK